MIVFFSSVNLSISVKLYSRRVVNDRNYVRKLGVESSQR